MLVLTYRVVVFFVKIVCIFKVSEYKEVSEGGQ